VSGRLPGCRRSGEVTRLRRLVDQHSGGGTGVNARRVSAALSVGHQTFGLVRGVRRTGRAIGFDRGTAF
jgi:hypothetical protein